MEHADLIKTLGGPDRVAAALGCHRTVVVRWRTKGIPPNRFPAIVSLAAQANVRGVTLEALYAGRALTQKAEPRRGRAQTEWHSKAAKLRAEGLTPEQIGRAFDVNTRTVQRVLRKAQA